MIDDRMVRGIVAGMTGAIVQDFYALMAKYTGFTHVTYLDVAGAVLFNKNFKGFLALLVALLGQFVIDGFWGCGYSFLLQYTTRKYYLIKGIFWGCGIWFLVRVIITKCFHLPVLSDNTPPIVLFFFVGAVIFGTTIAVTLKLLSSGKESPTK